ncbi:hypothetical protein RIF29_17262 [Crotalaria pallida]|uniref:Uncharacterized protein n=1 Tax=Crotalaria pallida TaxID=3830 RepID=A0AAN9IF55_CROPI
MNGVEIPISDMEMDQPQGTEGSYKDKLLQNEGFRLNSSDIIQLFDHKKDACLERGITAANESLHGAPPVTVGVEHDAGGPQLGMEVMHVDQNSNVVKDPEIDVSGLDGNNAVAKIEESSYGPWMIVNRNNRRRNLDSKGRNKGDEDRKNHQDSMDPKTKGSRFAALVQEGPEINETSHLEHVVGDMGPPSVKKVSDSNGVERRENVISVKGPQRVSSKPNRHIKPNYQKNTTKKIDMPTQKASGTNPLEGEKEDLQLTKEQPQKNQDTKAMGKVILDSMRRLQDQMWRDHKADHHVEIFGNYTPVWKNGEVEFLHRQNSRGKEIAIPEEQELGIRNNESCMGSAGESGTSGDMELVNPL